MLDLAVSPAKIVIERRMHAGADAAFVAWVERVTRHAATAAGHQGTSVLASHDRSRFILVRFDNSAHLQNWLDSQGYADLMRQGDALSDAAEAQVRTGFETWFTLPGRATPAQPPPKWKMALLTWVSLFPIVAALSPLVDPLPLSVVGKIAVSTAIPVASLTWVVMPRVSHLLCGWLYRR